jgi:nucleoside-diphosphate-sugar epimerase
LAGSGFEITAVHHGRDLAHELAGVSWRRADLTNAADINALADAVRPTHLLALAWHMGPDHRHSAENYRWIQHSLELLFAFARNGGRRAVFCGSCAEYDWSDDRPLHETHSALRPACDYGVAKAALFRAFGPMLARLGVSGAWARPFFLYGPGENGQRLVASVVRALLERREALTTDGSQKRDFLHVGDAARALVTLLGSDVTGPVNIASGRAVPVAEIVREIARQTRQPGLVRLGALPQPPAEAAVVEADTGRLRREVGFSAQYDLSGGLADTIAWWRTQLEREPA